MKCWQWRWMLCTWVVEEKMFKAISQKYAICNHILGTGKKHAALTDNELSQEPHRLEWTAQLEILQITVAELCPGALTSENLRGLHFKLRLSLQANQSQWTRRAQLPSRQSATAFKVLLLFLPDTENKPTFFLLICNNRVQSSQLKFWPLFPHAPHSFAKPPRAAQSKA